VDPGARRVREGGGGMDERFHIQGHEDLKFAWLADAAQEAEFLHATHD
jgi:hypothetical protein